MMNKISLHESDLVENPTPRVPVCLVLDTSYSMSGPPIAELNKGITQFFNAVKGDDYARYSVEIAIVTFGGTAKKILHFENIDKQKKPILSVNGGTPMGKALEIAATILEERKQKYQDVGVDYHQPWLVLMTDGQPTDDIKAISKKISEMVVKRKLTIFPVAIGAQASLDSLAKFSPIRKPLRLQGLKFKEFFEWLGNSISGVSSSMPGEHILLDEEGIKGWLRI